MILSDYGKGGLTHIARMIGSARAAGKPVLVDPKGDDYARYRGATLITPNRAELREVVGRWKRRGRADAKRAQRLRAELRTRCAAGDARRGRHDAVHAQATRCTCRPQAREVFDVSGAGDTVIATLAVMLAGGLPLDEAMRLANRAAGIVVGKFGTAVATARDELFASLVQARLKHAWYYRRHRRRRLHRLATSSRRSTIAA